MKNLCKVAAVVAVLSAGCEIGTRQTCDMESYLGTCVKFVDADVGLAELDHVQWFLEQNLPAAVDYEWDATDVRWTMGAQVLYIEDEYVTCNGKEVAGCANGLWAKVSIKKYQDDCFGRTVYAHELCHNLGCVLGPGCGGDHTQPWWGGCDSMAFAYADKYCGGWDIDGPLIARMNKFTPEHRAVVLQKIDEIMKDERLPPKKEEP